MLVSRTVVALRSVGAVAARRVAPVGARASVASVRCFAAAAEGGSAVEEANLEGMTGEELKAWIESIEGASTEEADPTPLHASGEAADIVRDLFKAHKAKLPAIAADVAAFNAAVTEEPLFVAAVFDETPTSDDATGLAMSLLFEDTIKSYDQITDKDLAEEVVQSADVFPAWLDARESFKATLADMTPEGRAVIEGCARDLVPHLLTEVETYLHDVVEKTNTVASVIVYSAVDLTSAQQQSVKKALPKYLPAGKTDSDVSFEVAEDVVGGIVLEIDNSVVDISASTYFREAVADGIIE